MNKRNYLITALSYILFFFFFAVPEIATAAVKDVYVVVASKSVKESKDWMEVVKVLQKRHKADVVFYEKSPSELLNKLKNINPRYVAIVEKPEFLNRDYIRDAHKLSRRIDDDIYADYVWGVITGYSAEDAMNMVTKSAKPFVIKTALATTCSVSSGKWFDRFAWLDDGKKGIWGEKLNKSEKPKRYDIEPWEMLTKFADKYEEIDPDFIVSSSHATEEELEVPFSMGSLKAKQGMLYADLVKPRFLPETQKPRVYFAAGNCLIGNVDNTKNSMAIGWMKGGGATTMIGYVVTTWYGRNGWGGLKYWLANPGALTLAQAVYLNQQDMVSIMNNWDPKVLKVDYPFEAGTFMDRDECKSRFKKLMGREPSKDEMGFIHDKNVLAFYGDPKWDVRLQEIPAEKGYTTSFKVKGKKCIVTIKTNGKFDPKTLNGGKLKQNHVGDIPFNYFFPKRLKAPKLAVGQDWKVALAEDFIIVYNTDFKPNGTYKIVLDIEK